MSVDNNIIYKLKEEMQEKKVKVQSYLTSLRQQGNSQKCQFHQEKIHGFLSEKGNFQWWRWQVLGLRGWDKYWKLLISLREHDNGKKNKIETQ